MNPEIKTVTMEGENWRATMTPEEYSAWSIYDHAHPHLSPISVESLLEMFLNHYRRGIDLNQPLKP